MTADLPSTPAVSVSAWEPNEPVQIGAVYRSLLDGTQMSVRDASSTDNRLTLEARDGGIWAGTSQQLASTFVLVRPYQKPEWQTVTVISDTAREEVNCANGDHRVVYSDRCSCGEAVLIEMDANRGGVRRTCRMDGKRVFYPDSADDLLCVFRCRGCGEPIDQTCATAAFPTRR